MMHVQIIDGAIVATRATPTGGAWEDEQWLNFTDPDTLAAWEVRHGLTQVVEIPKPVETDTIKYVESIVLIDGIPTQKWTARPWTTAEIAERTAREERIADREAVKALFTRIDSSLTEARDVRTLVQTAIDGVAPTNVAQAWARIKDTLQLLKRTDAVLIDVSQDVKALAKYVKEN